MTEETAKIPKFRKTGRIARWMEKNEYEGRLPAEVENLFFTTKEEPWEVLVSLTNYHDRIDQNLPENLENLLYEKAKQAIPNADQNLTFIHDFLAYLRNRSVYEDANYDEHFTDESLSMIQKYVDLYKGKSQRLVQWAKWTNKRLPAHLEDSIDDPREMLDYAKEVVRGRVPSHLEDVFFKDVGTATQYAFDVIRGFAPVKLPDALHNFVIMESYKNTDDYRIKTYMKASESDPNKTNNSEDTL